MINAIPSPSKVRALVAQHQADMLREREEARMRKVKAYRDYLLAKQKTSGKTQEEGCK